MLHLTVSLSGSGYHPASWRVSRLPPGPGAAELRKMAITAERGKLDAVLFGLPVDGSAGPGKINTLPLDPLPLLGSMIGATRRLGLAAAWTVDYTEPFHVARVFATLDHLSYGRTAWIADMFGTDFLTPRIGKPPEAVGVAGYCERAGEFIDVVRKLWDSWEDAAFALDKASGMFVDPERVHPLHHAGTFFTVRGPLNVPRPPQGYPLLVLHDPTDALGREFAAANADVILSSCESLTQACARSRELRALATAKGRSDDDLRILATIGAVLGATDSAAQRRAAELDAMLPPAVGLRFVGTPEGLVELFARWQQERACDGFNLLPAVLPDDLDLLVEAVVPLAQRRGLFRTDYAGTTLREHFGLKRPPSQYEGRA